MNLLMQTLLAAVNFKEFSDKLTELFSSMWAPLIAVAASLATIWGVYLGLKYWKSGGDENKRKEAKNAVVSFIVGIVIIFAVAASVPLLITALSGWIEAV